MPEGYATKPSPGTLPALRTVALEIVRVAPSLASFTQDLNIFDLDMFNEEMYRSLNVR